MVDSPERKLPAGDGVDERQNHKPLDSKPQHHGEEVQAKLRELITWIFHLEDLISDQEADSDGGEVDDPGCDPHHHEAQALEEPQQRLALLTSNGDGDPRDDAEDDETELRSGLIKKQKNKNCPKTYNVGGVLMPGWLKIPGVLLARIDDGTSSWVRFLQQQIRCFTEHILSLTLTIGSMRWVPYCCIVA